MEGKKEFKGTKYPWKWNGNTLRGKENKIVHLEKYTGISSWQEKSTANRKLVEAAPELLETLQYVKERIEDIDEWWIDVPERGFDMDKINNVISKALD